MPKTPACSPLKRRPSQRFPQSLLISYVESPTQQSFVESPTQQSYVLATEDTSDADDDDEGVDSDKREYEDVHITPKALEKSPIPIDDADRGHGAARSFKPAAKVAAVNPKFSVTSTLQSARQALADARRRSFQLGERSLSATFQHMRSYSSSSMRFSDTHGTVNVCNNSSGKPPSPISSNQAEEQEQMEQREDEPQHHQPNDSSTHSNSLPSPVDSDNQEQQQQKKKRSPRTRAVSYQSALAKYLPSILSRKPTAKRASKSQPNMETNDGSTCDDKSNRASDNNQSVASENEANTKRRSKSTRKTKRFPTWTLRQPQQSENKSDNQREQDDRESLRPATQLEEVDSDNQ